MTISAEISYYPLSGDFEQPVDQFIQHLRDEGLEFEMGTMSTLITGPYEKIMHCLTTSMQDLMEHHPSVFTLKISNACVL